MMPKETTMFSKEDTSRLQQADAAALILRLALGTTFVLHGSQKMFPVLGGQGWAGTVGMMGSMGIPTVFAVLAIIAEFFGGLGILFGLLTRLSALGIISVMAVAIYKVHGPNGFFLSGTPKGPGYEYNVALIGMALALVIYGAGRWSLDYLLASRLQKKNAAPDFSASYPSVTTS
jgi:putative oxidoreductase